jgi:colicin import membrane protein
LQNYENKDLHKLPSEHGKGLVGTTLVHLVIFLTLILVGISATPIPEMDEGIMVNFGTDETGFGDIEPSPPIYLEETSAPPPSTNTAIAKEAPILTQNTEEAPAVRKADPDALKKQLEKIEADKVVREQLEAERVRKVAEELELKRIADEQQRQTDIMNRTKNALANSKNSGTNSTSEGIAGGSGNQGDQNGSVNSKVRGVGGGLGDKGVTYSLGGRGSKALPRPKYDYQRDGIVVVEVRVDRSGKVVQAVPGKKGSTILDEYLLKVAKEAALEALFDAKPDAPTIQIGTITYNFILK